MTGHIAELVATLGSVPFRTPKSLVDRRCWQDFSLGRALVKESLAALEQFQWFVRAHIESASGQLQD